MRAETADRLLRALGADPPVFHAVYRAQSLMLRRRARVIRARERAGISSFAALCLFATAFGLAGAVAVLRPAWSWGAGLSILLGCLFLAAIVLGEDAGALVDPAERLILAAHPHDDRSLLLGKAAAVGRSLAVLASFLFAPTAIALCFMAGPGDALLFVACAGAAALTVALGGMLLAVLLLRTGGRRGMERLLPWAQGFVQFSMLAPAGTGLMQQANPSAAVRETIAWVLPPFWFAAPLELAGGHGGWPVAARLILAAGCLALVVAGSGRLAAGMGRDLLEPQAPPARARKRPAAAAARRRWLLRHEGLRLVELLRLHLRADWRSRTQVFVQPLIGVSMILIYVTGQGAGTRAVGGFFLFWLYGVFAFTSAEALTTSARPQRLWWLLSSPIDRTRFSLATISVARVIALAPLTAALAWRLDLLTPGTWRYGLPRLLGLVLYGDLFLLLGKICFPEFPFSRPSVREGSAAGNKLMIALLGALISLAGTIVLRSLWHFGTAGVLTAGALALLLHVPAWPAVRRRTARAAAKVESGGV